MHELELALLGSGRCSRDGSARQRGASKRKAALNHGSAGTSGFQSNVRETRMVVRTHHYSPSFSTVGAVVTRMNDMTVRVG